jgi:hypothetical protein
MQENPRYNKPDFDAAAHWILSAAQAGLPMAMYNLGVIYRDGLGTDNRQDLALKWLAKAESHGVQPENFLLLQPLLQQVAVRVQCQFCSQWSTISVDHTKGNLTGAVYCPICIAQAPIIYRLVVDDSGANERLFAIVDRIASKLQHLKWSFDHYLQAPIRPTTELKAVLERAIYLEFIFFDPGKSVLEIKISQRRQRRGCVKRFNRAEQRMMILDLDHKIWGNAFFDYERTVRCLFDVLCHSDLQMKRLRDELSSSTKQWIESEWDYGEHSSSGAYDVYSWRKAEMENALDALLAQYANTSQAAYQSAAKKMVDDILELERGALKKAL